MPIPLAAVASLLSTVPSLYRIFKDEPPPPIVEKALAIASSITGEPQPEKAIAALETDPVKMAEFRNAAENRAAEMIKWYLDDLASARTRDTEIQRIKGSNRRADAMAGLAVVTVIACLWVVVMISNIDDYAKGVITMICGRALGWVEQVFSFEFGTTKSSKDKDATIQKMAGE